MTGERDLTVLLRGLSAKVREGEFAAIVGPDRVSARKPSGAHLKEAVVIAAGDPERAIMVGDAAPDADAAFKVLRTQFGTLSDARDTAQQTASAALEAAFDFMEQAFAESQEMVVFVTELTLSPAAHAFIAENGCERYFQYNKDLLLDHRKAALNQELEAEQRRHGML